MVMGFGKFNRVLDSVMQERARRNIGLIRKQAQVISLDFENQLWERNILGEDTPDKLRSTVFVLVRSEFSFESWGRTLFVAETWL